MKELAKQIFISCALGALCGVIIGCYPSGKPDYYSAERAIHTHEADDFEGWEAEVYKMRKQLEFLNKQIQEHVNVCESLEDVRFK